MWAKRGSCSHCWVLSREFAQSKIRTSVCEKVSSNSLHRIVTPIRFVVTLAGVFNVWFRNFIIALQFSVLESYFCPRC